MAVFAWETSSMIDQLSSDQKKFVRSMHNKYQIYVITEKEYKRKDQQKRVKELVKDATGLYYSDYKNAKQFHTLTKESINNDLMKLSGKKYKKSNNTFTPNGVAVMGFKTKKNSTVKFSMKQVTEEEQKQEKVSSVSSREKKSIKRDIKNQLFENAIEQPPESETQQVIKMLSIILEKQKQNDEILSTLIQKQIENTETQLDGTQALEVTRVNRKMANDLSKLTEMTIKGQSYDSIEWKDTPTWLRHQWKLAYRRGAVGTAIIPLKAVKGLLNQVLARPVVIVAKYYWGKLQFIVGHVYWFFIIGGLIHMYTISDYDTVNEMYLAYGGNIVNKFVIDPSLYIGEQITGMFPNLTTILITIWESTIKNLWVVATTIPNYLSENFLPWLEKVITDAVYAAFQRILPSWLQP